MSLQFITGGSGAGKSEYLSRLVCEESVRRPHDNFIVVVPEQYTMETQKKLVHMHSRKGILNIDVVSFERLAYKVFEELGGGNRPVLDDTGKNLIVRRVLEKEKKKLDYFGSSIEKTGFVSELKSVISELLQYGITPQQLSEIGENVKEKQQLSAKLKDIRLVYEEFMAFLSTNYITSEEILDVLCGLVEKSKLIAGSEIIFDGFTGFTPIQYKLMRLLLVYSKGIKISVTIDKKERPTGHEGWNNLFFMSKEMMNRLIAICEEEGINVDDTVCVDRDINYRYEGAKDLAYLERNLFRYKGGVYTGTPENIRIYEGSNPKEELQYIVSEILQLTRKEGFRYRDIAVVTADLETYGKVAANMMKQNDIPAFLDYKRSVAANPYVEMLCSALEIVEKGYPYDTMFRYLRTGLTGISRHDIDMLENYCLAVGIRGSRAWHEPWKKKMKRSTYQPELETLNALREQIMAPFLNLEAVLKDKEANVRAYVTAVYEFVTALHSAEQIKALSECEPAGNEYEQLYAKVLELFDRIVELLGEEKVSLKEFNRIVAAGFEEMKVGLLPPTSDCVMIGDIERTRLDNVKVLFFAGVNDGVVPKKNENCSVLSETDRSILEAQEIVLSPSAREKAFIQKFYLYLMMTKASHRLYLSYAKKSSDGKTALPSYLIRNVRRMFPDVRITDADGQDGQFVYLKIPKQDIEWNTENYIKTLSENAALLLYGTQLKGSISAFETYASCRFAYFLEYGLKLSQREEYRFAVQDFGTVLHGVLEDVSRQLKEEKKSFSLLSDEERKKRVSESVVRIAAEYGNTILKDNSRNEYMIKRLTDLADRTVWAIGKQLERGEFAPDAYEMNFLVDEHEVLGDKSLYMQGKIDRIDICEDDNNVYVRVVDYKTGKSDFDLLKTFYGLKLQLVTYMKAAQRIEKKRHPDKNIIPAGILYYNIDNPIIEVQSMPDEEDADYREAVDEMILENLRMKGVVNEDTEIIRKMDDRGGKSAVIPVAFKSNGELDMRSHIYSTQKFEQLTDYVTEKSADMAAGIFSGNVDVNPYHTQKEDACTYCPYHAVCGFSPDIPGGQSRSLKTFSDEEIWKKIREGVDENGKPLDRKTVQGNPDKRL